MAERTLRVRAGALTGGATAVVVCALLGCTSEDQPALSKGGVDLSEIPVPKADGPKLGALADITPIRAQPSPESKQLGYLHAGGRVARSEEPYGDEGCPGGWYAIRPRGFVCVGAGATTDLGHPTLVAMALQPKRDAALPYTYARTKKTTPIFERDPKDAQRVREVAKLTARSGAAIVGSWSAKNAEGGTERLGLMTNGQFLRAADLRPAEPSAFEGVDLRDSGAELPIGFVVKQGVRGFRVEDSEVDKLGRIGFHEILPLTGKYRELKPYRYWAVEDGRYVRHRDVTVVRRRHVFPDLASGEQKWIDISIITGTLTLYEGKKPIFTTLVSVGRDRLGDPKLTASTAQGTFEVIGKHVTAVGFDPKKASELYDLHDLPWAIELSSGQLLHGAYWHDRFGIEHSQGSIELSPADARRLWEWVDPALPEGWHGVTQPPADGKRTLVVVRK
ncbi:MAG TPA: L,D-transpeptidase [Polyangiaceae bacterium]|nr:L,D-transpeptidase [Polyangiaceae bacterium]